MWALSGHETVSYAWGDASLKVPVACNGKRLDIPASAHAVLDHLRYKDRSRFLRVDAVWYVYISAPVGTEFVVNHVHDSSNIMVLPMSMILQLGIR